MSEHEQHNTRPSSQGRRINQLSAAVEILLIEDNPGDVRLTREALRAGKVCNNLHVVHDGIEALDFLCRVREYATKPRPDLILLDLNLPGLGGREVLERVKTDPLLRSIPVVVLTSSRAEEDVVRAHDLHVNCFITKPVDFDQFVRVVKSIDAFALTIVRLPSTDVPTATHTPNLALG